MVGRLLACVDMFVRVRSQCDGQTMRDLVHGFNGLYRGGSDSRAGFRSRQQGSLLARSRREAENADCVHSSRGAADGMLTPASLKTQRRQDQKKEGSAPLCVFASLREPIRVLRALRGPKNLTSLNHESHRAHESFHERCHQREPWQTQEARENARPVRGTWSGLPSRLRLRFLSNPAFASREVAKAAKIRHGLRVPPDDRLHVHCLWGRLR
jgi:hypothetical protein